MTIDRQHAEKAWPHLVKVAKSKRKITYGKICEKIDPDNPPNPRFDAHKFLKIIKYRCEKKGLPLLDAVVVRKKEKTPGDGWCEGGKYNWEAEVEKVAKYDKKWPLKLPSLPAARPE